MCQLFKPFPLCRVSKRDRVQDNAAVFFHRQKSPNGCRWRSYLIARSLASPYIITYRQKLLNTADVVSGRHGELPPCTWYTALVMSIVYRWLGRCPVGLPFPLFAFAGWWWRVEEKKLKKGPHSHGPVWWVHLKSSRAQRSLSPLVKPKN